ncbi:hypothetical protein PL321_12140 [Caloramator sp. mosi_1]|nr:hypothetical protein [Caloramator sp. mosi_1]WDC83466.1 hypothetical protein PL321_12140 [Caloramator sp. mosi_1]
MHYEFLINTIKELLTNAYKYSFASEIDIEFTIYDSFLDYILRIME